jgi:hypothetical protein
MLTVRRWTLVFFVATLFTPLLVGLFAGSGRQADNRVLAPPPGVPTSFKILIEWPHRADAYLNDHFGLRSTLVRANAIVNWYLFGSSANRSVIVGRHGRLFLSEGEVPNRVILGDCGAWWSEGYVASFAQAVQAAIEGLQHDFGRLSGLFVPTSAVLYPEDLPLWMADACADKVPLVDDILARLPQSQQRLLAYPKAVAASLPSSTPLIPKRNFHWDGQGASLFMEAYVESRFGLTREAMPIWRPASKPSDIARFLPGVSVVNQINIADWAGTGVVFCQEMSCLNASPFEDTVFPRESMRVSRPGPGGKLLLLSDSFGAAAAAGLIEYFADILMINMNNYQVLELDQRRALLERLKSKWGDAQVLVLVEDGNITLLSRFAKSLLAE